MNKPVLVLVGSTASGKSEVAIQLAHLLDGEIISADSMQIYRGMDIGTGKVPENERIVPHFGLDILDPGTPYSASLFQKYARQCVQDIQAQGCVPVLVGGTGFYVRSVIDDYDFSAGEQLDNPVRETYTRLCEEKGPQAVWDCLHYVDPQSAAIIHPHNTKRVIRALEMHEYEGTSYALRQRELRNMQQYLDARIYGLHVNKEELLQRIYARVDAMFDAGLVAEVQGLLDAGFADACTAADAIGYKEIVRALNGEYSLDEAREYIKIATRRYAKRQRSWWRKDERVRWVEATVFDAKKIAQEIAQDYNRALDVEE